jgi:hypothetical protein
MPSTSATIPKRSFIGLNAANFFQVDMVGVILPIPNAWLKKANWRYDAIGFDIGFALLPEDNAGLGAQPGPDSNRHPSSSRRERAGVTQ